MGFIKASEFADKYNITRNNVYTYQKRGKILITDGLIDESNPINKLFIASRQAKEAIKQVSQPIEQEIITPKSLKPEATQDFKDTTEKIKSIKQTKDPQTVLAFNVAINIDKLREQKLHEEVEGLRLKNKIQAGELIPIDYAINVFGIYLRSIVSSFYNTSDNYTVEICNRLAADRVTMAELRGLLKKTINESTAQAKEAAKKDLITAAQNYKPEDKA